MGKSLGFKEEKCLLSLLKSALWGDVDPLESIGVGKLCKTLTLAREHMVEKLPSGVCDYAGTFRNCHLAKRRLPKDIFHSDGYGVHSVICLSALFVPDEEK